MAMSSVTGVSNAVGARGFDISPFSLPNCEEGEVRFEEPRDIQAVVVHYADRAPEAVSLHYMHKIWPDSRIEVDYAGPDNAMSMGWYPIEDWFNCDWREAAIIEARRDAKTVVLTFKRLATEFPSMKDYDVTFRRTQGFRVTPGEGAKIDRIEVYTTSKPASTRLRVQLDAGAKTPVDSMTVEGYNAEVVEVKPGPGATLTGSHIMFPKEGDRSFSVEVRHMSPSSRFSGDDGHLTFAWEGDAFTISLSSLEKDGPIWFADRGIYITRADDRPTFDEYHTKLAGMQTIDQRVMSLPEQSLGGAMNGQPRPHADAYYVGCKNARQRFRVEPNGDIVLSKWSMDAIPMRDTPRFKDSGDARFVFGMERMRVVARYPDPEPILAFNTHMLSGDIRIEQKAFAVPLLRKMAGDHLVADDSIAGVVRFTIRNTSDHSTLASLPVSYSSESGVSRDRMVEGSQYATTIDPNRLPISKRDKLAVEHSAINPALTLLTSDWKGQRVVRSVVDTAMACEQREDDIVFSRELQPGETCTVVLKIPYVEPNDAELKAFARLRPDAAYSEVSDFWRGIGRLGAQIHTPEPRLDAVYKSHFAYVSVADMAMPDQPDLINTSVGTSLYGNYTNEACMIVDELEERGLHDEARRRIDTWIKYQGTAGLLGNFSDHDGVLFGAGGYESGNTYDQHHGWALWRIAEHYFASGDEAWMKANAGALIKGADWVFRQRRLTMCKLPHSRGWEHGFLPAGSLEDVSDYSYWLSTNAVTWRGVDAAAAALEAIGHPDAARVRKEADAYKADLIGGFEKSRQHSPLVRLSDGRWVPHYPSRLYLRGRDTGWIREVLEGSVYLLITRLYEAGSEQARWILNDYQDNRYLGADYGYPVFNRSRLWYDVGGFSCQPNLLAGLTPYLDRDEPELYLWMFFNAWAACYREESNSMVEHPMPTLGHSNQAIVKTSDESNAVKWLSYMFVYAPDDTLYLGRAIPRDWLTDGRDIWAHGVSTRFGEVSVAYHSDVAAGRIRLDADLALRKAPGRILARIRHPNKKPIRSVKVNGHAWTRLDAGRGDIDISGLDGKIVVEAAY